MARGLDEEGREHVRQLVNDVADIEEVTDYIDENLHDDADIEANWKLFTWMREQDYRVCANHLAQYLTEE